MAQRTSLITPNLRWPKPEALSGDWRMEGRVCRVVHLRNLLLVFWLVMFPLIATAQGQEVGRRGDSPRGGVQVDAPIEWEKAFPEGRYPMPEQVIATADGGCLVAARSDHPFVMKKVRRGVPLWLIMLSSAGEIQWQKIYGADWIETRGSTLTELGDGYRVASNRWHSQRRRADVYLLKLDRAGAKIWDTVITNEDLATGQYRPELSFPLVLFQGQTGGRLMVLGTSSQEYFGVWCTVFDEDGALEDAWRHASY